LSQLQLCQSVLENSSSAYSFCYPDLTMPENDAPENRGGNRGRLPPVETRWKKGQSGNPGGRPKKKPLSDAYRKSLSLVITPEMAKEMRLPAGIAGMTIADVIAMGQAMAAIKGSTIAAREIADRIEGRVDVSEEERNPGPMIVVIHAPRPNREGFEAELRLKREAIAVKALPSAE
jgi:Family of unknown function (DUF5681)